MFKLYYAPDTCALAPHIALRGGRRPLRSHPRGHSRAASSAAPPTSRSIQGTRPCPRDPSGHSHREPGAPRLHRADLPRRKACADRRSLRICPRQAFNSYLCSTVHLSPRARAARSALGGQSRVLGRHEAEGPRPWPIASASSSARCWSAPGSWGESCHDR